MASILKVTKSADVVVNDVVIGEVSFDLEVSLDDISNDDLAQAGIDRGVCVAVDDYNSLAEKLEEGRKSDALFSQDVGRLADHIASGEIDEALHLLHSLVPSEAPLPTTIKRLVADRHADAVRRAA